MLLAKSSFVFSRFTSFLRRPLKDILQLTRLDDRAPKYPAIGRPLPAFWSGLCLPGSALKFLKDDYGQR